MTEMEHEHDQDGEIARHTMTPSRLLFETDGDVFGEGALLNHAEHESHHHEEEVSPFGHSRMTEEQHEHEIDGKPGAAPEEHNGENIGEELRAALHMEENSHLFVRHPEQHVPNVFAGGGNELTHQHNDHSRDHQEAHEEGPEQDQLEYARHCAQAVAEDQRHKNVALYAHVEQQQYARQLQLHQQREREAYEQQRAEYERLMRHSKIFHHQAELQKLQQLEREHHQAFALRERTMPRQHALDSTAVSRVSSPFGGPLPGYDEAGAHQQYVLGSNAPSGGASLSPYPGYTSRATSMAPEAGGGMPWHHHRHQQQRTEEKPWAQQLHEHYAPQYHVSVPGPTQIVASPGTQITYNGRQVQSLPPGYFGPPPYPSQINSQFDGAGYAQQQYHHHYLQLRENSTPVPKQAFPSPYGNAAQTAQPTDELHVGHRHSHPSTILTYGAAPPPPTMQQRPNSRDTSMAPPPLHDYHGLSRPASRASTVPPLLHDTHDKSRPTSRASMVPFSSHDQTAAVRPPSRLSIVAAPASPYHQGAVVHPTSRASIVPPSPYDQTAAGAAVQARYLREHGIPDEQSMAVGDESPQPRASGEHEVDMGRWRDGGVTREQESAVNKHDDDAMDEVVRETEDAQHESAMDDHSMEDVHHRFQQTHGQPTMHPALTDHDDHQAQQSQHQLSVQPVFVSGGGAQALHSQVHAPQLGPSHPPPHAPAAGHHQTVQAPRPAPTLAMHNFVHYFGQTFQNYPPGLQAFSQLVASYNNHFIDEETFFMRVHQLLYRCNTEALAHEFRQFAPARWGRIGEGLEWWLRAVEEEFDEQLRAQAEGRVTHGSEMDRIEKRVQQIKVAAAYGHFAAGDGRKSERKGGRKRRRQSKQRVEDRGEEREKVVVDLSNETEGEGAVKGTMREPSLLVKLKIGRKATRALKATGHVQPTTARKTTSTVIPQMPTKPKKRSAKQDVSGRLIPLSQATPVEKMLVPAKAKAKQMTTPKKKVPFKGFRASGSGRKGLKTAAANVAKTSNKDMEPALSKRNIGEDYDDDSEEEEAQPARKKSASKKQPIEERSSSPLTDFESGSEATPAKKSMAKPRTPGLRTPGLKRTRNPSTNNTPTSTPGSKLKPKRKPNSASTTHASEIPHFGPIYPTRRAVLARKNRPYVHASCGQGLTHPQDVRGHHKHCSAVKKVNGVEIEGHEWNAHESIISYPDVNYTRSLDGFLVLDQESADTINTAIEAGLAYQRAHGRIDIGDDGPEEGGEESSDDGDEEEDEEEVVKKVAKKTLSEKRQSAGMKGRGKAKTAIVNKRQSAPAVIIAADVEDAAVKKGKAKAKSTKRNSTTQETAEIAEEPVAVDAATTAMVKARVAKGLRLPKEATPMATPPTNAAVPTKSASTKRKAASQHDAEMKAPPAKRQLVKAGPD
ncbi:hypothetical protein LTR10_012312 [Elasticomyces elasticus]|nr:hypothetical protein LTR10_012312 [Elasticomyces elasticus]KAK4965787.1 hypothetical protein LTR42_011801 [Elasticomyces elasticus]